MTCDDAALLIDDHVDGACDPATAAAVDRHLSTCERCRALAADLSRIRAAARMLGPVAPPEHVWAGIQATLQAQAPEAPSVGWRQPLAAAAGFALIVSALSWVGTHLPAAPAGVQLAEAQADDQFQQAEAAYQMAIDDLELIATEADAPALAEPAFVALHASLVDLDEAIDEARERLSVEPDDEFSQDSLLTALDNKVVLLQDAVALLEQDTDIEGTNP
jgi:anti-sigma factor RsiW